MFMRRTESKKNKIMFMTLVTSCAIFLLFVCFLGFMSPSEGVVDHSFIPIDDSWYLTNSDGEKPAVYDSFSDTISMSCQLASDQVNGRSLCFIAKNVYFDVYVDGELIYSFCPQTADIFGKYYGTYPHAVNLSSVGEQSEVTIEAETIGDSNGSFKNIRLEEKSAYILEIVGEALLPFSISIVIAILGICLILGGLSILNSTNTGKEIAAMGLFALDAGVWTGSSSIITGLVIGTPVSIHFVNYASLILLPALVVLFIFLLTGRKMEIFANAIIGSSVLTLAFDMALSTLGISTYHDLLFLSHIECILAVIYSFLCIIRTVEGKLNLSGTRITVTIAFAAVTTGGFIDLVRYMTGIPGLDSAYFFRIGLMIFIFLLGVNEMYSLIYYRKYESEAAEMGKLAHTDSLTGLQNRTAFNEYEERVKTGATGECIVIQLDVNNLKKVNDKYGHKAGDEHIKAAARIIETSFGEAGNCYRTGGDEFIVIIDGADNPNVFENARNKFTKLIDEYNDAHPQYDIKLEIAYGYEKMDMVAHDVEKALRLADDKMYLMKKQMKDTDKNA